MGGKDRTGILVALIHHILGVARGETLRDYLLTNDLNLRPGRDEWFCEIMSKQAGREIPAGCGRAALEIHPEYLTTAFAAMERRHGSIEGYLAEALGVGPEQQGRIRERFTEARP